MDVQRTIQIEDTLQIPTYTKYPLAADRGDGCYLWDLDGKRYIDFYGGHCVTPLGHCPEPVVQAVQEQLRTLIFYSNVVYSPVRARAVELLHRISPEGVRRVFLCNSGTEANETALKLARTVTGRSGIVAFEGGFHGRTLGALATTWNPRYREAYAGVLPPTHFAPLNDVELVRGLLERVGDVAAVIIEPIQSMAGVMEATAEFLRDVRDLCDGSGTLLIFDEVQTGVGRTGTFSMSEQLDVRPDIITMAKSLASGIPVGVVFTSDQVADTVKPGDQGTTFGGGMIAMAALEATVGTIVREGLMGRACEIFDCVKHELAPLVTAVRGRGCLIGVELTAPAAPVIRLLRDRGVLVGSSSHERTLRLMPPLNTPPEVLDEFFRIFRDVVPKVGEATEV
jgi:acetylornithine/succinyldiaminopimelate/putrescine aminotransferase